MKPSWTGSMKKTTRPPLTINQLPAEMVLLGGLVIDALQENIFQADLVIRNGVIDYIGSRSVYSSTADIIDITGHYIAPGFFDMHVHFREPGNEEAENLMSGADAALAGGFTGVAMMPNTSPPIDNVELFNQLENKISGHLVDVHAIPAVTAMRSGEVLSDMAALTRAGALAFTDDGSGLQKGEVMKQALKTASALHTAILVHAEDESFATGVINESTVSRDLNLPGISNLSESVMVARDILIAETLSAKVHFQHVSTLEAVELIRQAKRRHLKVTAETAPHYFALTDESTRSLSADFKMKPPLRTESDRQAIIRGLADGTIDAIATDHAPHRTEAKALGLAKAPFGVTGLETSLGVGLKYLVEPGLITLVRLVKLMAIGPRHILGMDFDLLKTGKQANLTVFDQSYSWICDAEKHYTRSINSPFKGCELKGRVKLVINKGKYWQPE